MDTDDYARLLAQVTVLERVIIMLAQQQPETALTVNRAELSQLAESSGRSSRAYGEGVGQTAARLLADLR